jgi:ABC-type lipoprotein export system ATPase subunit
MLALEEVVKHFQGGGEEVRAVDGVSLELRAGEMVALQGPSGSGKTTLLLLVAGLIKPDQGSIRFDGRELGSLSDDQVSEYLLRDVGFIYQSFHLMPRVSVLENAAMKLMLGGTTMREAKERALPWVERVGLGERLEHTPEQLSGGERQRVAIARALTGEPRVVLADEPTGNLDSARSRGIVALLHQISREQDTGVLLVTHDGEATTLPDRRHLMRDGSLVPDAEERSGEPAEQIGHSGTHARPVFGADG